SVSSGAEGGLGQERLDGSCKGSEFSTVGPGKVFHFPLLLLQKALELEKGMGLGFVWLRPADVVPFASQPHQEAASAAPEDVLFSSAPIKLHQLARWAGQGQNPQGQPFDVMGMQVSCPTVPQHKDSHLMPPFVYCVEVHRKFIEEDPGAGASANEIDPGQNIG
ncbi:unnamed protein product, partial [Discosporangium mesarthrocarpum]